MSNIIQNELWLILWDTGSGKTMYAVFLASLAYNRIYSNVKIEKNEKKINNDILSMQDAQKIPYKEEKGVLLMDEWGINIDSRNFNSDDNKEAGELLFLWRKKNIDIFVISQLFRRIDVNFREMANVIVEMKPIQLWKNYLKFRQDLYKRSSSQLWGNSLNLENVSTFDLFKYQRLTGINYNTLESSRMKKSKNMIER